MLEAGKKAPAFTLENQDGEKVSLKDFLGKWVVLYFYPRDNTPGCTNEACDFTASKKLYEKEDAVILGVSKDSIESHQKFIANHKLGITLLSDPDVSVHKKYGAWGLKKLYGKESEGVIRSTFLIDPKGKISESWGAVKVRVKRKSGEVKHAETVLEKLKEIK